MLSERELEFIALHKDNYPAVFRYVRRRVESPEVAEEIAADVFRVVWQKWGDQPRTDIAWLVTVARNMIGNAYRSRDRQRALQEKLRAAAVLNFGDGSENLAVHDAMDGLREKDRDILQLAYWDGLDAAEIADVLQCSESAAKVRLHRARAAFRKQMPAGAETIAQRMGA
ncbi:RNA polymerase sigma-70 factor (ECF subfamily) [Arthrobacter sp. PvP102]|uniref:RNA polymerase sigma factor n=1 Tax=unclassified Arthrobacter TaxID=235627 RepID=UPI00005279A5|nr:MULTISPECIES: sigma-70 family RNA polymerase sigma factor [unclassified Arthrobacter]ABK04425.1 RNA polymerase, sigma-24 subunit, ECF subfamily [Arthrobacter sp. FB24]MBP1232363.1 RNA polymerase sigma-70 factor (ECF subfamily) [Arthrobacter sp. PvP103]MBP1237498.1 RNA polymerase sigma-70 factor (ECF subfamily) [Arthrobacter sp. PvP102]